MHLPHEWLRTLLLLASVSGVCFHGMVDNDNDNDNDNVFLKYDTANRGVTRRLSFDGAARCDRSCAGVILSICPGLARTSNHSDERPGHELEAQ